ncbi:hypothetical protein KAR91_55330 [Candidatus Pacearchaeota archaeon]|nr:hypothetical protein [Candidatus Pacearchaeota archaeon]
MRSLDPSKMSFVEYVYRVMMQLTADFRIPVEMFNVTYELGCDYRKYYHMWE